MNYTIPLSSEDIIALRNTPVSEETVASAIAGVIHLARKNGQTLEELIAEILAEDPILDHVQRHWLSKIISQAWESFP